MLYDIPIYILQMCAVFILSERCDETLGLKNTQRTVFTREMRTEPRNSIVRPICFL